MGMRGNATGQRLTRQLIGPAFPPRTIYYIPTRYQCLPCLPILLLFHALSIFLPKDVPLFGFVAPPSLLSLAALLRRKPLYCIPSAENSSPILGKLVPFIHTALTRTAPNTPSQKNAKTSYCAIWGFFALRWTHLF